jgi:hypothetical protein
MFLNLSLESVKDLIFVSGNGGVESRFLYLDKSSVSAPRSMTSRIALPAGSRSECMLEVCTFIQLVIAMFESVPMLAAS